MSLQSALVPNAVSVGYARRDERDDRESPPVGKSISIARKMCLTKSVLLSQRFIDTIPLNIVGLQCLRFKNKNSTYKFMTLMVFSDNTNQNIQYLNEVYK